MNELQQAFIADLNNAPAKISPLKHIAVEGDEICIDCYLKIDELRAVLAAFEKYVAAIAPPPNQP